MDKIERNIIEVKHLKKHYGPVKAVDDISFCVKEGELFAFLGLNGAGKSTTINVIAGIAQKDSGSILIDGIDIDNHSNETKMKIGIVFQNSCLDKKLTAYDNLRLKAALYGIRGKDFEKRLEELSNLLELKPLLKRTLEKMSGGQKRRIDIARALIHKPKILILDEPTTGLDPQTRIMVWECLNTLKDNKEVTIFLTTHYMEEAANADFVVILDSGHIVADDLPNNLKNKYAHDFIKIYDKSEALIDVLVKEKMKFEEKDDFIRVEVKNVEEGKNFIVAHPTLFKDVELLKGTMDEVFLKVTGKELKGGLENE
ncbi:MAG: ABC transporter ATP-binding protein [Erysipelotrichaceae bacterium]|nr:ABC transporter ATP-binding protein [Erysipelotrichaceae bacterium]